MDKMSQIDCVPQIYCSLRFIGFDSSQSTELLFQLYSCLGITLKKESDFIIVTETGYIDSWNLTEVVAGMFSQIAPHCAELKAIKAKYACKVLIDIAFHHYDRYPVLIIEGKAMQMIHYFEAEISIDPY